MKSKKELFVEYGIYIIIIVAILGFFIIRAIYNGILENKEYPYEPDPSIVELKEYDYKKNEYKVLAVEPTDYMFNYYQDFIYLVYNDEEGAWDHLTKECQNKFKTLENFKKYLKDSFRTTKLKNSTIEEYNMKDNKYIIIDTAGYEYFIKYGGIWEYKVDIKGRN